MPRLHRSMQRGASLVEVLLAFLVVSLGFIGIAKLQALMRHNADIARQRSEAVQLAQEDIEALRSFASMTPATGLRDYAQVASAAASSGLASNTAYALQRSVSEGTGFRNVDVAIAWQDRTGQAQHVTLQSAIAATPPSFSGALLAQAGSRIVSRVKARSVFVPLAAEDLGDGTSVFKPAAAGTVALVFDNVTGMLRARCNVASTTPTQDLSTTDLSQCTPISGTLLSGFIRWSLAAPPDAAHANDVPLPVSVALALSPAAPGSPECIGEAQKMISFSSATGTRREAVPIAASPSFLGLGSWVELGERFVAYHCVVPLVAGGWSGRSTLVPQGWAIGATADAYKVCRYSADQDGSGAIDANAEHPAVYSHVMGPLMQQNFLVIRGDQSCPATSTPSGSDADVSTVQHQP